MKFIYLTIFIFLGTFQINAQKLADLKNKALKYAKIFDEQKKSLDYGTLSNSSSLRFTDSTGKTIIIKSRVYEGYCGTSSSKTSVIGINQVNAQTTDDFFSFKNGKCYTEASTQWQNNLDQFSNKNLGLWSIIYATEIKGKDVMIMRLYSEELMTKLNFSKKDREQHITVKRYFMSGDSVFIQNSNPILTKIREIKI
jgi:hypothetical protein